MPLRHMLWRQHLVLSDRQGLEGLPIDDPLERVEQFINAQKQIQNKDNNEIIEIKL